MTGLLKSDNPVTTSRVRNLRLTALQPPPVGSALDPELAALKLQVGELRRDIELKAREIDRLKGVADSSSQKSFAEGFAAGKLEGQERREQSLQTLKAGIERAQDRWVADMEGLERLAVQIAQEALGKIVGDPNQQRALLAQIIRKQTENLEAKSILQIFVSSMEFTSDDSITALLDMIGRSELRIERSSELNPGDCLIKLMLGELEVGINQQWSRIGSALTALSEPCEAL